MRRRFSDVDCLLQMNSWQIRTRHFDSVMNSSLVQAVSHCELPAGEGQVWLACEHQVAAYLKARFINEMGISRAACLPKVIGKGRS